MKRLFTIFILFIAFFVIDPTFGRAFDGPFLHIRGRILINVDDNGSAWYVHPKSGYRYSLASPENALSVMRLLALGIKDTDLVRIPRYGGVIDFDIADNLKHTAGHILLRVEKNGEAWYVHPLTLKRYRLGTPTEAFKVMSALGLGINQSDIDLVPQAEFISNSIFNEVPFVAQAPFGEWNDRRQHEGCEEASALMAVSWAKNETITKQEAKDFIIQASEFELGELGFFEDTNAEDTVKYIFNQYLGFYDVEYFYDVSVVDVISALQAEKLVLLNLEGRLLNNPNFRGRNDFPHMVVVVGYDSNTHQFITHDPGTKNGENYRYEVRTINEAMFDYPSGYRAPIKSIRTSMITVDKINMTD